MKITLILTLACFIAFGCTQFFQYPDNVGSEDGVSDGDDDKTVDTQGEDTGVDPSAEGEDAIEDPLEDPSDVPADEGADPVEDQTEDPTEDPVEDPTEDPVEDPVEDSSEDPVEDPAEEDPAADPSDDETGDPVEEDPAEEPYCGNGVVDEELEEECDDGQNGDPDDGCTDECLYSCHEDVDCDDDNDCTADNCNESEHTCGYTEIPDLSGVAQVASSSDDQFVCARMEAGNVKCWGRNNRRQLGDSTTTDSPIPVDVADLGSPARDLDSGGGHACAVLDDGNVKCWGWNSNGQLGDGTLEIRTGPVTVWDLAANAESVALGYNHSCALLTTGAVQCWGGNNMGQLGNNSTADSAARVNVEGLSSDVIAIAAGMRHSCAIVDEDGDAKGILKCWGWNSSGQLGPGTAEDHSEVPVDVAVLGSDVTAICAGSQYSCVLVDGVGVKCWGDNGHGQLGNGTTDDSSTPVDVIGISSSVTGLSCGRYQACALHDTEGMKCWGGNSSGQLGDGTTLDRTTAVAVSGMSTGVTAMSAGTDSTCALLDTAKAKCWGSNNLGQIGNGRTHRITTPTDIAGLDAPTTLIRAGFDMNCVVDSSNVKCWGYNDYGGLGNATNLHTQAPAGVSGLTTDVNDLSTGEGHNCAIVDTDGDTIGGLKCWGWNAYGQIGDATTVDKWEPVDVSGMTSGVRDAGAGYYHTCAVLQTGGVKCWGRNTYGQVGDGTLEDKVAPQDVTGLAAGAAAVASGQDHSCALMVSGGMKCWGRNAWGELGNDSTTSSATPVDVVSLGGTVTAISLGSWHTCALIEGGAVQCWGWNGNGQLGDGTSDNSHVPKTVEGLSAEQVAAGYSATCARLADGGVKCWGSGGYGQIGDGSMNSRWTPTDVVGLPSSATAISVGRFHVCALLDTGAVMCWGSDAHGQITGLGPIWPQLVTCG